MAPAAACVRLLVYPAGLVYCVRVLPAKILLPADERED